MFARENPLSHGLRRASSPEGGALFALTERCQKAPPSGELANAVSLRGFTPREAPASTPSPAQRYGFRLKCKVSGRCIYLSREMCYTIKIRNLSAFCARRRKL